MERAEFERVPHAGLDPLKVLADVAGGAVGLPVPVPLPRREGPPHPLQLPERVVLEPAEDGTRVLLPGGSEPFETWPRGAVHAVVSALDEEDVELELQWPGTSRRGKLTAPAEPAAVAVAEALARDTRARRGADPAADAALGRLAAATLPEDLRLEHQATLRALGLLLEPGEAPLVLARAGRGVRDGVLLLTDRRVRWWSGGRRGLLALARGEVTGVEAAPGRLAVTTARGRTHRFDEVLPPERAEEVAAALTPHLPAPHPLAVLLAQDPDEGAAGTVRHGLERARGLWEAGEEGRAWAIGIVGAKRGALVVTDRRLLWVPRREEPLAVALADVAGASLRRRFGVTRLTLTLRDGREERIDAVEPRDRADAVLAAVLRPR